jgi:hypothetical protein
MKRSGLRRTSDNDHVIGGVPKRGTYIEFLWFRIPGIIVMHGPGVEDNDCILGDELALVDEVFARNVRRSEPEGVVHTFDLHHFTLVKLDPIKVSKTLSLTSLIIAWQYGRFFSSSMVGRRERPTTRSSSACAFF